MLDLKPSLFWQIIIIFILFQNISHSQQLSTYNTEEDQEDEGWLGDDDLPGPEDLDFEESNKGIKVFHYRRASQVSFPEFEPKVDSLGLAEETKLNDALRAQVKKLESQVVSGIQKALNMGACGQGNSVGGSIELDGARLLAQSPGAPEFDYIFYDSQIPRDKACASAWQDSAGIRGLAVNRERFDETAALAQVLGVKCLPTRAQLAQGVLTLRGGEQAWVLDKQGLSRIGKELGKKINQACAQE